MLPSCGGLWSKTSSTSSTPLVSDQWRLRRPVWRRAPAASIKLHKDLHQPVLHRSRPTTQKRRPLEKLDRSSTTTRTEKTRLTSRERVCSSNMMSGGTPRRRRGTPPRLIPPQETNHCICLMSGILSASAFLNILLTVLRPKTRNRKLWKDEGRWEHDKFREEEQAPKSREELIAIYGYDIRNGSSSGERSYRQRRPR